MMGKKSFLAMRAEQEASDLISSDFKELVFAAKKLANHAIKLGSLGFGTSILEWIASFAAMYATLFAQIFVFQISVFLFLCCQAHGDPKPITRSNVINCGFSSE